MDTTENSNKTVTQAEDNLCFDKILSAALEKIAVREPSINKQLVYKCELEYLIQTLTMLKTNEKLDFNQLTDLTAVDYPERPVRFRLIYQLLSITNNSRVRIICPIDEGQIIPSITGIYKSAEWPEREVWDMYGLFFSDHPDLRRLLTDYGFEGHPLRKDFPLTGYVEVRYDDIDRRVAYQPVQLTQEYRDFDFLSPWEGDQELVYNSLEEPVEKDITFDELGET